MVDFSYIPHDNALLDRLIDAVRPALLNGDAFLSCFLVSDTEDPYWFLRRLGTGPANIGEWSSARQRWDADEAARRVRAATRARADTQPRDQSWIHDGGPPGYEVVFEPLQASSALEEAVAHWAPRHGDDPSEWLESARRRMIDNIRTIGSWAWVEPNMLSLALAEHLMDLVYPARVTLGLIQACCQAMFGRRGSDLWVYQGGHGWHYGQWAWVIADAEPGLVWMIGIYDED